MSSHLRFSRRTALKSTLAATSYWIAPQLQAAAADSPNEKLNIAFVGIGGRGFANVMGLRNQNVVALCDVDHQRGAEAFGLFPRAKKFADFRVMFDKMEKDIDAVVVSTPDHTHFHPSMAALERGKHLYCEKPMAHNVWEVRTMTDFARRQGVATQLGCQRHALRVMHRAVELVQAGAIGTVNEVHSWVGGERGMPKVPDEFPQVPEHVDWDLWLGPAKERPFHPTYCPYGWRFWWDFGTGETGNWGCHILDIPFWALGLRYPDYVEASGPQVDPEATPKAMRSRLRFESPGVDLHWYHAKEGPPILAELDMDQQEKRKMNTIFVGDEGILVTGFQSLRLLPEEKFREYSRPDETIPDSPGFYREWIEACKGGPAATCHFDYSGPLTESVLLANAAYRAEGGFHWDAGNLQASGNERVEPFLTPSYRPGWEVRVGS